MQFMNEKLNPAIGISIFLMSSIGFVSANLFPTNIQFWAILLLVCLIVSVAGMIRWHSSEIVSEVADRDESKPVMRKFLELLSGFLPLLIFTPAIIAFLTLPDASVSNHGELHANYIIQILHGQGVPDNGFFPEAPVNYYWLYHAIVAAISYLSHIPFPIASVILSMIVLASTLGWAYQCLRVLFPQRFHPAFASMIVLLLVFGFNALGILYSLHDFTVSNLIVDLSPSAPVSNRLLSDVMNEFFNISAFSIQIMYLWMGLYAIIRLLNEASKVYPLLLLIISLGGGLATQLSGGFFIVMTLIPAAILADIVCAFLEARAIGFSVLAKHYQAKVQYIRVAWGRQSWLLLLVACLLLVPLFIYTIQYLIDIPSTRHLWIGNLHGFVGMVSSTFSIIPFLLLAGILSVIQANRIILTCVVATIIGWLMFYGIVLPGKEQYKFLILSTTFFMPAAVWGMLQVRVSVDNNQRFASLGFPIVLIFAAIVLFNIVLSGIKHYEQYNDNQFSFEGQHVLMPEHPYTDVFTWLRDNTGDDTILVMDVRETRYAALLSERRSYLVEGILTFVDGIKDYDKRSWAVTKITSSTSSIEERQEALKYIEPFGEEHPLVFIVADEATVSKNELDLLGMILLFDGDIASVYEIGSDK